MIRSSTLSCSHRNASLSKRCDDQLNSPFQDVNIFDPDTPRFFPESFEYSNNGGGVRVYRNNGDGTFTDVAQETGTFDTGWGWAGKFFDLDNDGWLDLYVVNGWVSAGEESYVLDIFEMILRPDVDLADLRNWPPMGNKTLSGYQRSKLFHNDRGQFFVDRAARHGVDSIKDGRGVAVADFDKDGWLDLFVANANNNAHLYRNVAPPSHREGTHWISFLLEGTRSNRDAVGAQLRVTAGDKTYLSFVNGGNGFASQSSRRVHFGLGSRDRVDRVKIRWPSGATQSFENLPTRRLHLIREGEPPKKEG